MPVHNNWLSIDMVGQLIDLFCLQQGSVIDPYSCSMTTELASMRTRRAFVPIEKDKDFFDESFGRLRQYLPPSEKLTDNMSVHPHTTTPKSVMKICARYIKRLYYSRTKQW